jgi:hypothetical protein
MSILVIAGVIAQAVASQHYQPAFLIPLFQPNTSHPSPGVPDE